MGKRLKFKKSTIYSLLTAFLFGVFIALLLIGMQLLLETVKLNSYWLAIISAFVIAFLFQPFYGGIRKIADKIFFSQSQYYQRIIKRYSHALTRPMADMNRFSRLASYLLTKSMDISGASVLVIDREKNCYTLRAGEKDAQELEGFSIKEGCALLAELKIRKKEICLDEINSFISSNPYLRERYEQIAKEMESLKASLVIPSISKSEYFGEPALMATINLGKKLSGKGYSREDIGFLRTLANEAAISIEYAVIFEELKKNQERMVHSEKLAAIGTTTAGVAHELKNPLTYLSTVAQILPKKWDDQHFRQSVTRMLPFEIQRMQLIVEGLLHYSRSKELTLKPLELKDSVEKALALLNYDIKKNQVIVKTQYWHKNKANADPDRLMQVLVNIISNAVQAMGQKGGSLIIKVEDKHEMVEISFKDTGPGIQSGNLKKIFDPFYTTKDAGTGLGLAITKKIIEEHKGKIFIESEPGIGTTFRICFPKAAE
jgi:two-component system NtrC family sensor kinase